ncbi:OPT oligopeptide transporter protein-domain-containing protein [Ustulina deusta]|nr:OPT oligopeptide transporter protein-domain-containing protein [Ustulina deusta]
MGGLKTAFMTRTAPRAVLYAQMIGSVCGALISTVVYRIYTSVKTIPSKELGVPEAYLWLASARINQRRGLPSKVWPFMAVAFFSGALMSLIRLRFASHRCKEYIPSSIAMAVGMYISPAISLPRAIGSLILVIGRSRFGISDFVFMCVATGLILGQGLFSLLALLFDALNLSALPKML